MNVIHSFIYQAQKAVSSVTRDRQITPELRGKLERVQAKLEKYKTTTRDPKDLADRLISILHYVDKTVENQHLKSQKAQKIHERLLRAETSISQTLKNPRPAQPVQLAFFCDLNGEDMNGVITRFASQALKNEIPFITTRSILKETHNIQAQVDLESEIRSKEGNWHIFQKGEFIIFLPKARFSPEDDPLDFFDFKEDGSISEVTAKEALTNPTEEAQLDQFISLFSKEAAKPKILWIAGHGGVNAPAGLTKKNYEAFLQFSKEQGCVGLNVTSCYAGGESSLLHLPEIGKEQRIDFPVIVNSIGDFPTSRSESESLYFSELTNLLRKGHGHTPLQFQKMVKRGEGGKEKDTRNLIQVYFPPSRDSPGGFRPIGEGKNYSLTYSRMRQEELEGKKLGKKGITVEETDLLEIHPLVVNRPLKCTKNPVFLSLIPGKAHHFFKELDLNLSFLSFLQNMEKFYSTNLLGVNKAFFIQKIKDDVGIVEGCVIFLSEKEVKAIYFKEGSYYLWEGKPVKPLTPLQFASILQDWALLTKPEERAVRSQVGGQQENAQFDAAIAKWGQGANPFLGRVLDPSFFATLDEEGLDRFVDEKLEPEEVAELACLLLRYNRSDLVMRLLKEKKISPNSRDWQGDLLLIQAAKKNDLSLIKTLLQVGADVKLAKNLLHIVIENDQTELVDLLLTHPDVDINGKDKDGKTPLFFSLKSPTTFKKLLAHGANVNAVYTQGNYRFSILTSAYWKGVPLEALLQNGADPLVGDPPALFWAFTKPDKAAVAAMVSHGFNPFVADSKGRVPFIDAINRSSPEIIELLLASKHYNKEFINKIHDKEKVTPLLAALRSRNEKLVDFLIREGARLPSIYDDLLEILREQEIRFSPEVQKIVSAKILALKNATSTLEMLGDDPDFLAYSDSFFSVLLEYACRDFEGAMPLLEFFRAHGANLSTPLGRGEQTPLKIAFQNRSIQLATYLLENGANPNTNMDEILRFRDPKLIELAMQRGANLNLPPYQTQPLAVVANLKMDPKDKNTLIKKMILAGADISHTGSSWPFARIVERGDEELILWCLENGAAKEPRNIECIYTKAFSSGNIDLVNRLKEKYPMPKKFLT